MLYSISSRTPINGSLLFSAFLFAFGFIVQAGDPIAYSNDGGDGDKLRTEERFIPRYAVAGGYISWASDADFSSAIGSLSQWETGVRTNVPVFETDKIRLTAGIQYRYNQLNFTGAPAPLANMDFDLHRLDVPFNFWADLNSRWKLWIRLQPGWYSDFDNVGSDDFILTTLALLSYQWNEKRESHSEGITLVTWENPASFLLLVLSLSRILSGPSLLPSQELRWPMRLIVTGLLRGVFF